jgi:hypothetical protein
MKFIVVRAVPFTTTQQRRRTPGSAKRDAVHALARLWKINSNTRHLSRWRYRDQRPRTSLTVGHCGNPGGLRHRLNPSLRGPRNDDRSRERSINETLRETEIFIPSKAGAIVGSIHRGPCAGKQRVKGANRTARPDHERGSSDPMCRPPLYAGHRGALCLNGQSVHSQPLPQIMLGQLFI